MNFSLRIFPIFLVSKKNYALLQFGPPSNCFEAPPLIVGDGHNTYFWKDPWIKNTPLSTQYRTLYLLYLNRNSPLTYFLAFLYVHVVLISPALYCPMSIAPSPALSMLELRRLRVKLVSLLIWAKPFYTRILGCQQEAPVYREMPLGI
jgi:hypothetical protein